MLLTGVILGAEDGGRHLVPSFHQLQYTPGFCLLQRVQQPLVQNEQLHLFQLLHAIRPFTVGRKNWLFCDTPKGGKRQCHCLHSGRDCQGERTGTVSLSETAFDRTALFGQDSEPGGSDAVSPVVQDHAGCLHGAENKHQCTEGSLTRSLGCLLSRAVIKRLLLTEVPCSHNNNYG